MTQPEKASLDAPLDPPAAADDGGNRLNTGDDPGPLGAGIPAAMFLVISLFLIVDIASDLAAGTGAEHLVFEFFMTALALTGIVVMWRQLRGALRRARDLQVALDGTRQATLLFPPGVRATRSRPVRRPCPFRTRRRWWRVGPRTRSPAAR